MLPSQGAPANQFRGTLAANMVTKRVVLVSVLAVASALCSVGCGPTLGMRAQLALRMRAFHPTCDGPYRVLQLADNAFEVSACGDSAEFTDVDPGDRRELHLMRPAVALAREEMQCDYDALEPSGDRTPTHRVFVGCGASASYDLFCNPASGCAWQRSGEIVAVAPQAPSGYGGSYGPAEGAPVEASPTEVPPPPPSTPTTTPGAS